jgi:hypothetical protein
LETHRQNRKTVQTIQNPCLGMCSEVLGLLRRPWLKRSWFRTLGPGVKGYTPQGQEQEERRKYLLRELRVKLYDETNRLRRDGVTYSEMINKIRRMYGVRLSTSHISYWTRGVHDPYNGRCIPSTELLRPSEELAYVIVRSLAMDTPLWEDVSSKATTGSE